MTQPPIVPGPYDPQQGWAPPPGAHTPANALPVSKPPAPRWVLPLVIFLVIMVVGLAALLLVPKLWAARPVAHPLPAATTPKSTPSPTVSTFTVTGGLRLIDKKAHWKLGSACSGSGGFQDIHPGADVALSAGGLDVALSPLEPGLAFEDDDLSTFCQFVFTLKGVPAGKGIYTLTIGHRTSKFTEDELRGDVSLTLGG